MSINITGHNIQVTPALRDYVVEKFERVKKRGDHITSVNIILDVEKLQQIAKATIHVSGADLHAHSESGDMYSAIDLLIDKLDHQITKHKEKMKDRRNDHSRESEVVLGE